jgi:hypothetical protein
MKTKKKTEKKKVKKTEKEKKPKASKEPSLYPVRMLGLYLGE